VTAPRVSRGAEGAGLRRLGLALAVVWVVTVVLVIAEVWVRRGDSGGSQLAASIVSAALLRTWGWLAAALAAYLTGVIAGLRVHRPRQVVYRPPFVRGFTREKAVPVAVVGIVVVALAVAMIQRMLH
jgi:hypothetical protein